MSTDGVEPDVVNALDVHQVIEMMSATAFQRGLQEKVRWPLGAGSGIVVYPLIVLPVVAPDIDAWISRHIRLQFSAFEFPVLADLSNASLHYYRRLSPVGIVYWPSIRREVRRLFAFRAS